MGAVILKTQVSMLQSLLHDTSAVVKTVDSCQGGEADIVMLSTVRSASHRIGFLSDRRRLNVSLVRYASLTDR